MAEVNWGPGAQQATYHNQYDQGFGQAPRAEPPLMAPAAQAASSQYVHPAHGGAQPQLTAQAHHHAGYDDPSAPMMDMAGEGLDQGTRAPSAGGVGTALNYAGAALSLALIVGLGVWGYKLAMRDVTGIPVVRAIEGPMRVQPENPGGQSAAHQGFAVNDVQSEGQAAAPADRLVLAPAPEDLAEEDMTTEVSARADSAPGAALPLHEASAIVPAPEPLPVDPVAAALAIAEQIAADAQQLSGGAVENSDAAPATQIQPAAVEVAKIIPASVPGVKISPRPSGRPANLDTSVQVTPAVATAPAVTTDIAPENVAVGTRMVQLGAFDSAEVARAEWDKLAVRFEQYLGGKSRVIQKAQSSGKTFYRLRAVGFDDLADTRRFCSVLMAEKAACIPVVAR